jgi:hypothetical protein
VSDLVPEAGKIYWAGAETEEFIDTSAATGVDCGSEVPTMNKFFLRPLVACTCFVLSLGFTSIFNPLRHRQASIEVYQPGNLNFREDEKQLREIYFEYGPAQTRQDRAFFEAVETEDFVLYWGGRRLTREDDIQLMEKSPGNEVFERHVEYIKIFGSSAVVHGRMSAHYGDGAYLDTWNFIDTWVKRGNEWKIQSTTSVH